MEQKKDNGVRFQLDAVIVTFLEVKEGNDPFFMKRKFKNEEVAINFVSRLLSGERKVKNVQLKINYFCNKEAQYE